MAAAIVPECSIVNSNKLSIIYNDCNVWFGIKTSSSKKVTIINHTFHLSKNEISSNSSRKIQEIVGQFITSLWFSTEASIQNSFKFYVVAAKKMYSRENVEEIINIDDDKQKKFYTYDSFTLSAERLYTTFDKMLFTNSQTKRINLYSKHNASHVLNIHLSIKHLFINNDENDIMNECGTIKESVIIDTPTITYT